MAAALPANAILASAAEAAGTASAAAVAAQPAGRPLRRPDDGEPLVRPLLRLGERGGRAARTRRYLDPDRRLRADAPLLDARQRRHGVQGLRPPGPGARLGLRPRAAARRLPRRRLGQRRVRADLLQRRRARLHPRRGARLHALRPLLLLAARLDVAEPLLQVVRAVRRAEEQRPARGHGRQPVGDDLRPRDRARRERPLLRLGPAVLGRLGSARRDLDEPGRRGSTPTARPARSRTSRSSTRPSATAAAATGSRPTSTRSATCGSARPSWPTW